MKAVDITRVVDGVPAAAADVAASEEPLEIRLQGATFLTVMRTPGADRELVAGLLLAEGIIVSADDLGTIRHCTDGGAAELSNVIDVTLAGGAADGIERVLAGRRLVAANTSCGVCGRATIDDLLAGKEPLAVRWRIGARVIERLPEQLRGVQPVFDETGGLHAAALFDRSGALVASAEDVGRHNAVDKVIGRQLLLERLPLDEAVLVVSGRTSFEIVQKAIAARIPVLASVSAPSSLAIDLARDAHVTLVGFVRGRSFNVYAGVERIEML